MRFLICGLGSIGRRHLRNLRSLGQEDIVLLRTHTSTLPDDELGGLPVASSIAEALARWDPDAVIVSNPTAAHLGVAVPAAEAGCHLLIEKPISHSMEGIDTLRRAVDRGGGRVLVGFQFRFHPGLQEVKRLLDQGSIGRPLTARAEWAEYLPDWHPWEDYRRSYAARKDLGGGALLTLCHPFDYLRWLLGEVDGVQAMAAKLGNLEIDVEDTAEVILSHRSGAMSSVHLDYLRQPPCHRLEISGTTGSLTWDNQDGAVDSWVASDRSWHVFSPPAGFERNSMFLEEVRHFAELVAGREPPVTSLDDGVRVLEIALRARACSESLSPTQPDLG
jgi:predicted dehydrogenase